MMLKNPSSKYTPFPAIHIDNRQWPNRSITAAPIWMSTDLRDGNQALFEPMNAERKMRMFRTLCEIGFKEIEVAFPSASQTDFDFVRQLIEGGHIPDDVTIEVLTQAREHLIRRTIESLQGARRAIVHVYNATSKPFRETVFGMSKAAVVDMAVARAPGRQLTAAQPETEWRARIQSGNLHRHRARLCPRSLRCGDRRLGRDPGRQGDPQPADDGRGDDAERLRRPDRVDAPPPRPPRQHHPQRASAQRPRHGGRCRRTGDDGRRRARRGLPVRQRRAHRQRRPRHPRAQSLHPGRSPGLDFSDINAVARTVEHCNQLPVHPRHPYVGDLVFTAFSGSHQDAIKKGFAAQAPDATLWNVPYLPIDPADLGRSYDSVIRVNSQSGKGGIAYLLEAEYGVVLPRRLQVEFSRVVQAHTDRHGGEMSAAEIWQLFAQSYLDNDHPVRYVEHHLFEHGSAQGIRLSVEIDGRVHLLAGEGNGPIDAAVHALRNVGFAVQLRSYEERSLAARGKGSDASACAFLELARAGSNGGECYGVGVDENIVTASIKVAW
jgi:2-isopropylmalate synthase